jgi:hypothetical protein
MVVLIIDLFYNYQGENVSENVEKTYARPIATREQTMSTLNAIFEAYGGYKGDPSISPLLADPSFSFFPEVAE